MVRAYNASMPRIIEDTSDSATPILSDRLIEGFQIALDSERAPVKLVKKADREKILLAFEEAFELIGGVPRLAVWANENPGKFYALYARNAAKEQKTTHTGRISFIRPAIAPSPLDQDFTDAEFSDSDAALSPPPALSSVPRESSEILGNGVSSPSGEDSRVRK